MACSHRKGLSGAGREPKGNPVRKSFIALWSSLNYLLESTRELIKNIFAWNVNT